MSNFAQYYMKFKGSVARDTLFNVFTPQAWEQRQKHLQALFDKDDSVEFALGDGVGRKEYKHRVYHLSIAPEITVMRFANSIDIPVEKDFQPATAKDEPSCFVIIDNRDNLRTVAIQKRKKAFGDTRQVAKILSTVICRKLNEDYGYGFEIVPDYYPEDLFKVWERQQVNTQSLCFGVPEMDVEEILKKVAELKAKNRDYFDDSLMPSLIQVLIAQKQAKYKGRYMVMPNEKLTSLYVDRDSVFMRNLLTYSEATEEPVELITKDGATFRCFIDKEGANTDRIVSHAFDDKILESLFNDRKKDGTRIEPEERLKAEEEVSGFMNSMKHEADNTKEEEAA